MKISRTKSTVKVVNQVVRLHLPWAPDVKIICVHRREVPDIAEAQWIRFACENQNDPAVIGRPELRAIIDGYNAKQKESEQTKQETSTPEQAAE